MVTLEPVSWWATSKVVVPAAPQKWLPFPNPEYYGLGMKCPLGACVLKAWFPAAAAAATGRYWATRRVALPMYPSMLNECFWMEQVPGGASLKADLAPPSFSPLPPSLLPGC